MIHGTSYGSSFVEFDKKEAGATNLRILDKVPVFGNIPINREYTFFNTSLGELRQRFKIMQDIGYKGIDDTYLKLIEKERRASFYGQFGLGSIRPTEFVMRRFSDLHYNASSLYGAVFASPPIASFFAVLIILAGGIPSTLVALIFFTTLTMIILDTLTGYGFYTSGRALQYMKYTRYEYTFKSIDGDPNGRIINRTKFLIDEEKISKKVFINSFYQEDFWKKYPSKEYASSSSRHYGVGGAAFLSFPNSYNRHKYQELNRNLNELFEEKKKIITSLQINIPEDQKATFLKNEKELIDKTTDTDISQKAFFIDIELDNCVYQRYANRGNKIYINDIGTFLDISPTSKGSSGKAIPYGEGKTAILKSRVFNYFAFPKGIFVFKHASSLKSYNSGIPDGSFLFDGSYIYPYSSWIEDNFVKYVTAIRYPGFIGGTIEIENKYRRSHIFADYPVNPKGHEFGIIIGKDAPLYN